jgi:hypothetical protein
MGSIGRQVSKNMAKTVNEYRTETVSQTLSGGAIHYLTGLDIVR